jgi:hypothetical protein
MNAPGPRDGSARPRSHRLPGTARAGRRADCCTNGLIENVGPSSWGEYMYTAAGSWLMTASYFASASNARRSAWSSLDHSSSTEELSRLGARSMRTPTSEAVAPKRYRLNPAPAERLRGHHPRGRGRPKAAPCSGSTLGSAQRDRVDQVRVAQLPQRLAFDQPHALARQTEHLAGLPKGERLAVLQAVA